MRAVLAWDPVGIGDTWTGVAVPIAVVALAYLALSVYTRWDLRARKEWNEYDEFGERRSRSVGHGVVICDWVDEELLRSVARQKKAQLDPDRVETTDGSVRTAGGTAGAGPVKGTVLGEKTRTTRSTMELDRDPNTLLLSVMRAIGDDDLDKHLDEVPVTGRWTDFMTDELLEEFVRRVRSSEKIETAKDAVGALQESQQVAALTDAWKLAGRKSTFVVVENEWKVRDLDVPEGERPGPDHEPRQLWLTLVALRETEYPPSTEYGNPSEVPAKAKLPATMELTVPLDPARLTAQGQRLRHGMTVTAGVFGTTSTYEEAFWPALTIKPIAVYARVE